MNQERPKFPAKAVVTAGMPYGNKDLHFGHIGGVFVYADVWARFLRNRIGSENVIFVSGTDGYGSPIAQSHSEYLKTNPNGDDLANYVRGFHEKQKDVLEKYDIAIDRFDCSSAEKTSVLHEKLCGEIFEDLIAKGHLKKMVTEQFFDPKENVFLNGRQVVGKCPIHGCQSEIAYADECSLGHQYMPSELLFPKSVLSGEKPELRPVTNWFLDLAAFQEHLKTWTAAQDNGTKGRNFYIKNISEFFEPPIVHVKKDDAEKLEELKAKLPSFRIQEGQSKAIRAEFSNLTDREAACEILSAEDVRYRTGKTLVPFRLTGNVSWGLPIPKVDEESAELTWWVWPESLIAPLSFTKAYLMDNGENEDSWRKWWCDQNSQAFQFIGEDNVYFYGVAETAMFLGTQADSQEKISVPPPTGELQLPTLIVNNHLKFLDKKASSSGKIKPPMARDLLEYYTSDQLRAHFISLGLGVRSVSFRPKSFDPNAQEKAGDPVLKEGNLLANVFNRNLRSCFYTLGQYFEGKTPQNIVSTETLNWCQETILKYEKHMFDGEYHFAMATLDKWIRELSKHWAKVSKNLDAEDQDHNSRGQVLIDFFHLNRVAAVLMQPIAPTGCARVCEKFNLSSEEFFSWNNIFKPLGELLGTAHSFLELPPRYDFFEKHPSQLPRK